MRATWGLLSSVAIAMLGCQHHDDYPAHAPGTDPPPACDLVTCESHSATCGPVGDGCGGMIDCGACDPTEVCGGAGTQFACGIDPCTPRTCADVGATCGRVSDGCGGLTANCGTCPTDEVCGVGALPNTCAPLPCTGLCLQQDACPSQPKTTITGTVTAPGHANPAQFGDPDPIFGALVFVPNGAAGAPTYGVKSFTPGVACESCSSVVTGSPLVTTTTNADGTFTLTDAPCGIDIPLVIQLGRWRRQIKIPAVTCCANTALAAQQTHLPRNHVGEPGDLRSDIPLMGFSTGAADSLHCVLRKIGIDDSEFTNPSGSGRVRLYTDNGTQINSSTPPASSLYGSAAELAKYDMAMFECVGQRDPKSATDQKHVIDYANAGGRVFATHFSYVWLTNSDGTAGTNGGPKPFSQTASWLVDRALADSTTGTVDVSTQGDPATQTRRIAFSSWLSLVGASTVAGEIPVNVVRNDFNSVTAAAATAAGTPAQRWLFADTPTFSGPLEYTFDTPVAYAPSPLPTRRCGRVLFNDFHVSDSTTGGTTFPTECATAPMSAQEKTLEFMLFDLASCVGPPRSACPPRSCGDQGISCGLSGTGCDDGVVVNCGTCTNGRFCGGGGIGACGTGLCAVLTCADVNANCGVIGDGCGGVVDCGTCSDGNSCGGDSVPNVCGKVLL